jgi:predicted phosphodiesterase
VTDPLTAPARVALVGDWHANSRWATTAIQHAADQGAQVILHTGDYGYTYPDRFVQTVERELARHHMWLLFVDGNHDHHPWLAARPRTVGGLGRVSAHVWHLPRGSRWTWSGVRFLACGGAYSVDRPYRVPGVSWWKEETISAVDVARCADGGGVDVLISHDAPSGYTIPGVDDRNPPSWFDPTEIMRGQEHRQVLRRVVDATQPAVVFHGHYHTYYEAHPDLGHGPVHIVGLDCDGTSLGANVLAVDLDALGERIGEHRQAQTARRHERTR